VVVREVATFRTDILFFFNLYTAIFKVEFSYFSYVRPDRRLRLTTWPPSVCQPIVGGLNASQPYGLPRPVPGINLPMLDNQGSCSSIPLTPYESVSLLKYF
jgi:hypothetical protein